MPKQKLLQELLIFNKSKKTIALLLTEENMNNILKINFPDEPKSTNSEHIDDKKLLLCEYLLAYLITKDGNLTSVYKPKKFTTKNDMINKLLLHCEENKALDNLLTAVAFDYEKQEVAVKNFLQDLLIFNIPNNCIELFKTMTNMRNTLKTNFPNAPKPINSQHINDKKWLLCNNILKFLTNGDGNPNKACNPKKFATKNDMINTLLIHCKNNKEITDDLTAIIFEQTKENCNLDAANTLAPSVSNNKNLTM